jgi:Phage capsid family
MNRPIAPLRLDPGGLAEGAGIILTRAAIATVRGLIEGKPPAEIARRAWDDRGVASVLVQRAASSPAITTTAGWSAELAHLMTRWLGLLTPVSAGADLLSRALQLRFDGYASISLPAMTLGQAGFVGEGQPVPINQFTSSATQLAPHKLALASVLTAEMLAASEAELIVRQVLLESAARGIDAALFSANAASANAPAGLLYNTTPLTPSSSTGWDAQTDDLAVLAGAVARAAGAQIVFIAAPEQAAAILLRQLDFHFPVLSSFALAKGVVIAVAVPALVSAFGATPEISASRETTLVMNTAPPDLVTGGSAASPIASVYQTDDFALEMTCWASWALRASGAVSWMNAVAW